LEEMELLEYAKFSGKDKMGREQGLKQLRSQGKAPVNLQSKMLERQSGSEKPDCRDQNKHQILTPMVPQTDVEKRGRRRQKHVKKRVVSRVQTFDSH